MRVCAGWSGVLRATLAGAAALLALVLLPARSGAVVYWTYSADNSNEPGKIYVADLDGDNARVLIDSDDPFFMPRAIAADEKHIYFSSGTGLARADVDGHHVENPWAFRDLIPAQIVVGATHIYIIDSELAGPHRVRLDGTGEQRNLIPGVDGSALDPKGIGALALDDEYLYGITSDPDGWPSIGRARLDGSEFDDQYIDLAPNRPFAGIYADLVVDGSSIYYEDVVNDRVGVVPNAPGAIDENSSVIGPEAIGDTGGFGGLQLLGDRFYWAGYSSIGTALKTGADVQPKLVDIGARPRFGGPDGLAVNAIARAPVVGTLKLSRAGVNRKRGIGFVRAKVSHPGTVKLLKKPSVKPATARIGKSLTARLKVAPRGRAKKFLKQHGRVSLTAFVRYVPDGGEATTAKQYLRVLKPRRR